VFAPLYENREISNKIERKKERKEKRKREKFTKESKRLS
jgi:hypothetical protein